MDINDAIESFSALSQETRLKAFRLLVHHEPEGLTVGDIAQHLAVPHNTMSAHLAILARAGWVSARKLGRSVIYRASLDHMQSVLQFLAHDCCAGHPEICEPLLTPTDTCPPSP